MVTTGKIKRLIALFLTLVLVTGCLTSCGSKEPTDLMGNYAASDSVINYDVGAMKEASFADLLSKWFICDITEDMMTESYVFDEGNEKRWGSAFVVDRTDNKLLFGYDMFRTIYPASVTKLMTALVTLRKCDPKETVTIDAFTADMTRGSVAELNEGDVITVYNLLVVLLTISANNAAIALARHIAGSEEEFVKLMNEEMDRLGVNNTEFANASGLHLDNHKTTAYDMYIVYQECTKIPEFREIMKLNEGEYEYTNAQGEHCVRHYKSTNCFKIGTYPYPDGITILGGKTGTTDRAGYCLLMHVMGPSGREYIIGAFHCANEEKLYTKLAELMEEYCK